MATCFSMKTLHRDGFRCRQCGKAGKLEVDHILPIWKGGTDREENLQTLCRADHLRKTRRENAKPLTPAEKALGELGPGHSINGLKRALRA